MSIVVNIYNTQKKRIGNIIFKSENEAELYFNKEWNEIKSNKVVFDKEYQHFYKLELFE